MGEFIPKFESGKPLHQQLSAKKMTRLAEAIPRLRFSSKGVRVSNIGNQAFITLVRQPGGSGGSVTTILPWTIFLTGPVSGSYSATVFPGTVNGLIPTNLFASGFALNSFILSGLSPTSVFYGNVNVTTSGQNVTSSSISFDAAAAPAIPLQANSPPSTFSYTFGMLIGSSLIYRLIGEGNMYFQASNPYRSVVSNPPPNVLPWTDLWTWKPSIV